MGGNTGRDLGDYGYRYRFQCRNIFPFILHLYLFNFVRIWAFQAKPVFIAQSPIALEKVEDIVIQHENVKKKSYYRNRCAASSMKTF